MEIYWNSGLIKKFPLIVKLTVFPAGQPVVLKLSVGGKNKKYFLSSALLLSSLFKSRNFGQINI